MAPQQPIMHQRHSHGGASFTVTTWLHSVRIWGTVPNGSDYLSTIHVQWGDDNRPKSIIPCRIPQPRPLLSDEIDRRPPKVLP
jgi:hypothetical protein